MKKVLFLFIQIFIFNNALQAQKWVELGTGNNALPAGGLINAIAIDDSDYVYATVYKKDQYGPSYVSKWNGKNWNQVGTGVDTLSANNSINAIAVDKKGNVYAAGTFTNNNKYYYVAKWDGTRWSELASATDSLKANGSISSLVVDTMGNVYAAGDFANTSGIHYVAQWNGTSWSELGSGSSALNGNGAIYRMVVSDSGNVYVAGNFLDINRNGYIAKWDGLQWNRIGFDGFGGSCDVLALDKWENVYVAGLGIISLNAESIPSQYIQDAQNLFGLKLWNGKTWEEIDAGGYPPVGGSVGLLNEYYHSVAIDKLGNIYIGSGEQAAMDPAPNSFYVAKLTSRYTESILGMPQIVAVNPSIGPSNVSYSLAFDSHGNLYASGGGSQSPGEFYVAEWIVDTTATTGNTSSSTAVNPAISLSTKSAQNSASNLSVYPNPSTGIINIPNLSENVQLTVYNVLGESIINQQIYKENSYADLSNLSTGIYTLVFTGQQNSYVPVKWVKE